MTKENDIFNKEKLLKLKQCEIAREKYKPKKVKFLFVGESIPVSCEFFYLNNTHLYSQTKETFEILIKGFSREKFKELGCWLYDVCPPINHLNEHNSVERENKRQIIHENIPKLKNIITELNPEYIIIVKMGLFGKEVLPAINSMVNKYNVYNIPFPACGNQKKYRDELYNILKGKINE